MRNRLILCVLLILVVLPGLKCKKKGTTDSIIANASLSFKVNGIYNGTLSYESLNATPVITFSFSESMDVATVNSAISVTDGSILVPINLQWQNNNMLLSVTPQQALGSLTTYTLTINNNIKTAAGGKLSNPVVIKLTTELDDSDKFPLIADEDLLTLVEKQTFKYFYDFGHPVSGLARERNTSANTVTSGGSGFGIMAIIVGIKS